VKRKAATKAATAVNANKQKSDPKVVVLAEKLGSFLGRARKKADTLLSKVRPLPAAAVKGRKPGASTAPARRMRKPPPQELFDPRLGEPMGKQMGQKNLKRRGPG
jgi:hypothetical protein